MEASEGVSVTRDHDYRGECVVFFDVDGVLIDSLSLKGQVFAEVFDDFPNSRETVLRLHAQYKGLPRTPKIAKMYREINSRPISDQELAQRVQKFSFLIEDRIISAPEIAGATQTLQVLSKEHFLHAVSAVPQKELERILSRRQIFDLFRSVHGTPPQKESTIRNLMALHMYQRNRACMVGDSFSDAKAAKANGIQFIHVLGDNSRERIEASKQVRDLKGLDSILLELLDKPGG